MSANKPEVVAYRRPEDGATLDAAWMNEYCDDYTQPLIRLTDHEADRAADKALIAELGEELTYALADFDAWASHEDNHPHEHLVAWSERARAALAKSRGDT